ncbi:hypothetical protein [Streptomyces capoamus]|uniref:hypothetical protein n=1 Tax=Streptomyces capoamus TaxID=68183 RepID=UPI0033955CD4
MSETAAPEPTYDLLAFATQAMLLDRILDLSLSYGSGRRPGRPEADGAPGHDPAPPPVPGLPETVSQD